MHKPRSLINIHHPALLHARLPALRPLRRGKTAWKSMPYMAHMLRFDGSPASYEASALPLVLHMRTADWSRRTLGIKSMKSVRVSSEISREFHVAKWLTRAAKRFAWHCGTGFPRMCASRGSGSILRPFLGRGWALGEGGGGVGVPAGGRSSRMEGAGVGV